MSKPGEHKMVQARILNYAQEVGWNFVSREEAEARRGKSGGQGCSPSLFFDELLDSKVREFNPLYSDAEGALIGVFKHLHTDIHGNRDFVDFLRNKGKFFDHEEKRERDLILIDYDDLNATPARRRNVYEVTEDWTFHIGHYGTREDVVFLINGIPVLVIECKNADKNEAIALGMDQIRRYHRETPELFVSQQLFTATDAIGFAYGVTWNIVRRNIFNWKLTESGFSNPLHGGKGGQECPPSFFNPHGEIDKTTHRLPHWQQGEAWVFVTWRLGDSLPKAKLDQWKAERAIWLTHHPEPWDDRTEAGYHERFSRQIDEWLDQGSGSCVLKDPANAKTVADALRHFDGERYELASFVVMPNHVHVVFRPLGAHALPEIMKSWKGFTAREINKRIGKTGTLWQDEYWDRLIRNERHFFKVAEYILENPVKAQLKEWEYLLWKKESGLSSPLPSSNGGQECPPSFHGGLENPPSVDIPGRLEARVKSFCSIPNILSFLKD